MSLEITQSSLIDTCKHKLLSHKADLLNRFRNHLVDFQERPTSQGDEADQTVAVLTENTLLATQQRLRHQLLEIELALARIESGRFGFCEETEEPIEPARLLALPWTRLSVEGAELREKQKQTKRAD